LLRRLDPNLKKLIREDAKRRDISMQEVIREILCEYFELDCISMGGPARARQRSTQTILIKMQPYLFEYLKADALVTGKSMRETVLDALGAHYNGRRK
jgi:predicted HicB family RNase H-like nuclease